MQIIALFSSFFLPHGRITRSEWVTRLAIAGFTCAAFGSFAAAHFGDVWGGVFACLFIVSVLALSAKRLHDISRNGIVLLVALIPVIGPLWVLVQLLKRGVDHPNRFGADPASRGDYLAVNVAE